MPRSQGIWRKVVNFTKLQAKFSYILYLWLPIQLPFVGRLVEDPPCITAYTPNSGVEFEVIISSRLEVTMLWSKICMETSQYCVRLRGIKSHIIVRVLLIAPTSALSILLKALSRITAHTSNLFLKFKVFACPGLKITLLNREICQSTYWYICN